MHSLAHDSYLSNYIVLPTQTPIQIMFFIVLVEFLAQPVLSYDIFLRYVLFSHSSFICLPYKKQLCNWLHSALRRKEGEFIRLKLNPYLSFHLFFLLTLIVFYFDVLTIIYCGIRWSSLVVTLYVL